MNLLVSANSVTYRGTKPNLHRLRRLCVVSGVLPAAVLVAGFCAGVSAAELTETDARALRDAKNAVNAGKQEDAIKLLLPLQKKYPAMGDVPRLLTHAYYELKQFDAARDAALKAVSLGRMTPDVLARLAHIAQERDDQLALMNTVRLLTVLDADDKQWRTTYGDLLASAGSLTESAAVFRALVKEQPDSAVLHLRLGNVLIQQDSPSEAAVHLETAWHLGATISRLPLTLAGICQQMGDNHQACAWMERALESSPQRNDSLKLQLAQMLWDLGRTDRARELAEGPTSSDNAEDRSRAHVLLGHIAIHHEEIDTAVTHWDKAVEAGADSPQLLASLGAHYYNSGEFDRAAKVLQQAVEAEKGADKQTLRFLILSLIQSGNRTEAREYLRQYVEYHGLSPKVKELARAWTAGQLTPELKEILDKRDEQKKRPHHDKEDKGLQEKH